MRLKLDECVNIRLAELLTQAGWESTTVQDEDLRGAADATLYQLCATEGVSLVTLDLGLSNVLRYPPEQTAGIIVLRGPNDRFSMQRILIETLARALVGQSPAGKLWIVEPGRLRVHESWEDLAGC